MPETSEDPGRYSTGSAIRKYLEARETHQSAVTAAEAAHPGVPAVLPVLTSAMLAAAVHERWGPKTGDDPDSQALVGAATEASDIPTLRGLAVPATLPLDGRADAERHVYTLDTTLVAFRAEAAGDYHLVLGDEANNITMIGEIPKHGDFGAGGSYFADKIDAARQALDAKFNVTENIDAPTVAGPMANFTEAGVRVILTGLCFFDFGHGQRGVAPNAVELHPVIAIEFP